MGFDRVVPNPAFIDPTVPSGIETQGAERESPLRSAPALKKQRQPAMTEIEIIQRQAAKTPGREERPWDFFASL
ncbi:MAG: hypothetical protein WD045_05280, partial [Pirellulaceae bacterium]